MSYPGPPMPPPPPGGGYPPPPDGAYPPPPGGSYPPAPGGGYPRPGGGRRPGIGTILTAIVVVVVLGVGIGVLVLFLSGQAAAADVTTEPILTSGANPFLPADKARNFTKDQPGVTPPTGTAGSFPGNTPGLYGGTRNNAACDPAAMVTFLMAEPDKAAAWAGVLGIDVAGIPGYVAELTPVILRSDTYVTNHGFAGGNATTLTSVLQAGTAVLVDKFGVPRVRCFCGNPLTPATVPTAPRFAGPTWPQFSQTRITVIVSTTVVITNLTLVDPATDEVFERPIGTSGADDRPASGSTTTTTGTAVPTTPPTVGTTTTGPPPPTTSTSSAPKTVRVTGSHTLRQTDQPDCDYADAPRIDGTITITVQPDGSLAGTMSGQGSGTRQLTCGTVTAQMNWSQRYTVQFTGKVSGGRLTANGTLDNVNGTTLSGCTDGGKPSQCPNYEGGPGSYAISLSGIFDQATGQGSGSFSVDVARPTSGSWSVA